MKGDPWLATVAEALRATSPEAKCAAVAALRAPTEQPAHAGNEGLPTAAHPGRPQHPVLVHPREVAHRGLGTPAGRVALLHAVAHIEFNAINLALDAIVRFGALPLAYYYDWWSVAQDEARHFQMLVRRLQDYDAHYGDLPAHNGLWEMAEKTAHDPLHRMALVPRVLEARGLDVTPGMIQRLEQAGDHDSAAILRTILAEEVHHVAIGSHWFNWHCAQRGLTPEATFVALLSDYGVHIRPPLNQSARREAGFSTVELEDLGSSIR
ncbi:MAG: ferritin-like domain-containing protein [Algiphilus sp.]|uniref:ferritin-like domain-containing protein n=1 Tax=Algiphilus sp. TaxID=1872431 RepID=UPI001CA6B683|nr:ferritin-like domain-containing protein [Algiphilus sp.]MBY8965128.1 ferritin-like domain-containing protein [Algiphilus acroporae]MCI5062220.1 ferritin-like domain-containing protein [Algiphilus sp.]MCI5102702.1 ferritin-like domain-containing protein [Algiphilus sp.]